MQLGLTAALTIALPLPESSRIWRHAHVGAALYANRTKYPQA